MSQIRDVGRNRILVNVFVPYEGEIPSYGGIRGQIATTAYNRTRRLNFDYVGDRGGGIVDKGEKRGYVAKFKIPPEKILDFAKEVETIGLTCETEILCDSPNSPLVIDLSRLIFLLYSGTLIIRPKKYTIN